MVEVYARLTLGIAFGPGTGVTFLVKVDEIIQEDEFTGSQLAHQFRLLQRGGTPHVKVFCGGGHFHTVPISLHPDVFLPNIPFMQAQVALETTVMTHGLPRPQNLAIMLEMMDAVQNRGGVPKPIAFINGEVRVGLSTTELEMLAATSDVRKVSLRDLPVIGTTKEHGGTTVSATLHIAHRAGIPVFATGGIGGVHRDAPEDVSADLPALASIPGCVVCAGAKSILDLPRTRERLETDGVTVIGWKTDRMPAFYTEDSGLDVDVRVETPEEVADMIQSRDLLGLNASLLVVCPCPSTDALDAGEFEEHLECALDLARVKGVRGKALTPFLLNCIGRLTEGRSLSANRALLLNNARIATDIANALART